MTKVTDIAKILCQMGEQALWQPRQEWARRLKPNVSLSFRPGRGSKTYHQARDDSHVIILGVACLADQLESKKAACRWLSASEIQKRKYFGGRLLPAELLVHILCHEFAHFVQVLLGRRYRGSVHNKEFYEILDRIHKKGHADHLLKQFRIACDKQDIELRFQRKPELKRVFNVGDQVVAKTSDSLVRGYIENIAEKSVTIHTSINGRAGLFAVEQQFLELDTGQYDDEDAGYF